MLLLLISDEPQPAESVYSSGDRKDRPQKKPLQNQERKRENSDECRHYSQTNTRTLTDSHCQIKKFNQQSESTPSEKHFNSDTYSIEHELSKAPRNSTEKSREPKIEKKLTAEKNSESTVENCCLQQNVPQEEKACKSSRKLSDERFYIHPGYRNLLDAQRDNVMEAKIEPTKTKDHGNSQESEQMVQKKLDSKDSDQTEQCRRKMHYNARGSSHQKPQVETAGKDEPQRLESVNKMPRGKKENKYREKREKGNEQPKQHYRQARIFNQGDDWKTRQQYNDNMTEGNNVINYRSQEPSRHNHSSLSSGRPLDVSDYKENQQIDGPCNQYKPESTVFEDNRTRKLTSDSKNNITEYNGNYLLVKPSFRKDNNYSQNCDINPGTQHYPNTPVPPAFVGKPPPGFNPLNVPLGCIKYANPPPGLNLVNHSPKLNPPPGFNSQCYQIIPAEIRTTQSEHCTRSQPTSENQCQDNSAKVMHSKTNKSLAETSTSKTASIDSEIAKIQTQNSEREIAAPATDSAKAVQNNKIQVIDYWDGLLVEETTVDTQKELEQLPGELRQIGNFLYKKAFWICLKGA